MHRTADLDSLLYLGIQTGFGNDWVKFGSVKIFVDGEGRDEDGAAQEWPRITQDRLNGLVLGDLIVLQEDPFEVPVDGLKEIQVATTVIGGKIVHP